jgi:hydroxyethylthiazole kinase-like uncharacterized protein yjeF
MHAETRAIDLTARVLRRWPLPPVSLDADKDVRGRVLVVAGSRETPGAALLAAVAALRAGAGKLVIATVESAAAHLAIAVPEARVIALPETAHGACGMDGLRQLESAAATCDAALVGPGFMDEAGSIEFVQALLPLLAHAPVVLDALAMNVVNKMRRMEQPVLVSPHAGEMARLQGCAKEDVAGDASTAVDGALAWNAVVVLKGAATSIASPDGRLWRHDAGQPGLATSGSGDVLAGLFAGLAARGASLEQAAAWGVVLHALAGARLGPLGYLARELAGEVPALMNGMRPRGALSRPTPAPRE